MGWLKLNATYGIEVVKLKSLQEYTIVNYTARCIASSQEILTVRDTAKGAFHKHPLTN